MKIAAPRATLTTEAIQAMLNAAIARAQALNVKLHISIMDSSANLAGFISFDGAPRIAAITANRKAFTAVNTGLPTGQWEAYVNSIPQSELKIIDTIPDYIAAKGGYPVIEDGMVLGGIGVSGANQEIDDDVALAALKAVGLPLARP
jgi:uncharacterized protein GlcG (DUF336 family)